MNYTQEQQRWDEIIAEYIGPSAVLTSVSRYSSDRRVYRSGEVVIKVRRSTPASRRDLQNSLEDEALVLRSLEGECGPKLISYSRFNEWELLRISALPSLIVHDPTFRIPRESLGAFLRLAKKVLVLNRMGVSHGDLHRSNAGENVEGGITILDFDQACGGSFVRCFLRDFFGISFSKRPSHVSLLQRSAQVRYIWPFVSVPRRLRKLVQRAIAKVARESYESGEIADTEKRATLQQDSRLTDLARAWAIAASSNASAPGVPVAYYSIDIHGINFPGERPWLMRWEMIRRNINFKGKRFLELGCNLGMLSIHAQLAGAVATLGVDIEADIVHAAEIANEAFQTAAKFTQINLDSSDNWEQQLSGYDIVSALSVLHWVKDKQRAWRFIGTHSEVLYEGHESDAEAERNLRLAGFSTVSKIGATERARQVFYGKRA